MGSPGMSLGSAPESPRAPAGPETLVGQSEQQAQPTDAESQNRAFAMLVRSIHNDLDNLARQYPEMQPAAKEAKRALTDGMVKKMSQQPRSGESPQTPMG